jgi:predicted alpha-1,2-mannosidase
MIKKPIVVVAILLSAAVLFAGEKSPQKQLVDYVDPNIGGIGQLLTATIPYVQWPHGMARIAPITTPGITDRYLADKIYGFPVGPGVLMASTGDVGTNRATYASDFDHDLETATPYYYAADLQTWHIRTEFTATHEATYYRFTFPSSAHAHCAISLDADADLTVINSRTIEGSQRVFGPVAELANADGETREYFYAVFSRPLSTYETWRGDKLTHDSKQAGDHIGFVSDLPTHARDRIEVRVGISYIGTEQARRNLEREIPDWRFEETKAKTRAIWNDALGGITVTGGTERQRTIFYTALYRSLGRMTNITEDGRYFSGYDHKVHEAQRHDFYVDDGLWDTYRSLHPLQLLLNGKRQEDMVRSYIRMYEQSGWLNSFPSAAGEQVPMIGHHAAELILDTYTKGYRDFDLDKAYEAVRKNATQATMIPWRRGPLTSLDRVYFERGFFPALAKGESETVPEVNGERRQAVSVTLENSYDAWCVAQLAKILGRHDDEVYFTKLAHNYQNVYNPAIGFMAPRSSDGNWVLDFDPKLGGGQGGRDYFTEMNAWVYTFAVQHDVAGLIRLVGGRDAFNTKLDRLFVEQYGTSKFQFLGQFPDATGLVGQYAQGNEPSFHIPYLYDFSGQPWKTQRRVRQLMDVWYGDGPSGVPGDDDGGETSSWYVFSAIGFYPVCPGVPVYEMGSPLFERTTIGMGNGKPFTIVANHVSAHNKYIQSAELNGKPLDRAWFRHAEIAEGGTLVLEMADHPNLQWGRAPQEVPPSMSAENSTASGAD